MNISKCSIAIALCFTLVFLTASTVQAQNNDTLSLRSCLSEAIRNSPRLQASSFAAAGAQAAAREAAANRWPAFGVSGTYNYTSETQELHLQSPIPGFPMPQIKFGDGNVYDFNLNARVPIFTGGTLREKSKADASAWRAAQKDLAADSVNLCYDVRRAFFNAAGSEARLDAARQNAARLQRHLEELTAAQIIGTVSEENRLMTLSRLRQAEQQVLALTAETQAARLALGNLIGKPGTEIQPADSIGLSLLRFEERSEPAFDNHVDVNPLNARIEQSTHLIRASQGALFPAISGSAAYHYAKPGVNMTANEWMDYYTLGVTASWTLWDWNTRSYKVRQTRAAEQTLKAHRNDLVNSLRTRYESAHASLLTARDSHEKAVERVSIERQRLTLVEGRLHQGMANESEFLDTQDDLAAAETGLASAATRLRLAEVELLRASGR